jgi:putative ABC transport system ATP-binding protein
MNIVETVDVKKTYQQGNVEVTALGGVSLSIQKGSFVALAGPSGSGKTTMLNMIGGLDTPDSGRIAVNGNALETMSQTELASLRLHNIGFIFQAYNLVPVLSALENVEFVMLLQGIPSAERRDRAMSILDDVGLEGTYNRRPAELSGGQQQRVAVARAIVSNPSIVLADEPTANLDSKT